MNKDDGKRHHRFAVTNFYDTTGYFIEYNKDTMECFAFQYETTSNGRNHQQCAIRFKRAVRNQSVRKLYPGAHVENQRKPFLANIRYCGKDKSRIEKPDNGPEAGVYGDIACQGKRTDIHEYVARVKEGADEKSLLLDDRTVAVWAKYPHLYNRIRNVLTKDIEKQKPWVTFIIGDSGKGKTRMATTIAKQNFGQDYFIKTGNCKWWDGYDYEKCIIMDDFEGQMDDKQLLQFMDRYKYQGEIKGGTIFLNPERIIFTMESDDWFKGRKNIERRVDEIIRL